VKQACSPLYIYSCKRKITSNNAHKVFIRKKNFDSILPIFLQYNQPQVSQTVQNNIKHETTYRAIAREKYHDVLKYFLNRDAEIRETGCIIQPNIPWLVATPDGLVSDLSSVNMQMGIIEITCPKTKRNCGIEELLSDKSFYIEKVEGHLTLKKHHSDGYYTKIQMSMGLTCVTYCDFVVYTFKCMIIIRVLFDETFFAELISKLNKFYKIYLLPKLIESMPYSDEDEYK